MNAKLELQNLLKANDLSIVGGHVSYQEMCENAVTYKFDDFDDEEAFLNAIANIDYNEGYGIQELYGVIYCVNKTTREPVWLERGEYDGMEWWDVFRIPDFYKENFIKPLIV
jgi:hypothetical protein